MQFHVSKQMLGGSNSALATVDDPKVPKATAAARIFIFVFTGHLLIIEAIQNRIVYDAN